jgi:NAD(P)-dependent dehydrogenase (short-subunit alcohol dehydrogenase family)
MAKLNGKIALISGGSSGLGAETAKLFQSEGATVIATGSSERSVEAARAALPGIELVVSDAGNVAATRALVDQVKGKHGRIDILFVNAGIAKFAPLEQVDEWRPGRKLGLRLDQGRAAFVRPDHRQGAASARHPGQHNQPRTDRHADS